MSPSLRATLPGCCASSAYFLVMSALFNDKFGVDINERFKEPIGELNRQGFTRQNNGTLELTPEGYLQVDKELPVFFLPKHRGVRYT